MSQVKVCQVFTDIKCVLRSGTGGSMNEKRQQTECGRQDWKHLPECLDSDPALDTMLLFWHTTEPARDHPRHAPPSLPGNHVGPLHPEYMLYILYIVIYVRFTEDDTTLNVYVEVCKCKGSD